MKTVTVYKFCVAGTNRRRNYELYRDWDMEAAILCTGNDCDVYKADVELKDDEADETALFMAQDGCKLNWKLVETIHA